MRAATIIGAGSLIGLAALAQGMGPTSVGAEGTTTTVTFTTTGEHAFLVPAGVTSIHVVAIGETGGSGNGTLPGVGGDGAMVSADVAVTPGSTVYAEVNRSGGAAGSGGDSNFNPDPTGGTGGGESDLRTCSVSSCLITLQADPRLLVAGGGGGGAPGIIENSAEDATQTSFVLTAALTGSSSGGAAGQGSTPCATGSDATAGQGSTTPDQGDGGLCNAGGSGGSGGGFGADGGLEFGGQGGTTSNVGGGGGGAGFFGGGGGAADNDDGSTVASGAGGGGSSCAPCSHTLTGSTGAGPTVQLLSWHAGAQAHFAVANVVGNAAIVPAGGAAPKVVISFTAAVTPTPTPTPKPTVIPSLPATGSGPIVSSPWEPLLAGGGLLLLGLGLAVGRGRRREPGETP